MSSTVMWAALEQGGETRAREEEHLHPLERRDGRRTRAPVDRGELPDQLPWSMDGEDRLPAGSPMVLTLGAPAQQHDDRTGAVALVEDRHCGAVGPPPAGRVELAASSSLTASRKVSLIAARAPHGREPPLNFRDVSGAPAPVGQAGISVHADETVAWDEQQASGNEWSRLRGAVNGAGAVKATA
jgi:hypothetical protein